MVVHEGFTPPPQFDEYRILRPLGGGAMGQVFLAQDTFLDRSVAIKFIANLDLDQDPVHASEQRERFFIEARAIARLQHPNVVLVYRVGEWQKRPFLVSEFVRGQSLDRVEKPMPWQQVHRIAIGLARGLSAAHRRGVLHRDIKPANAMLTPEGDVKLLDFGLAKLVDTVSGSPSNPNVALAGSSSVEVPPLRDTQLDLRVPAIATDGELAATLPVGGNRPLPAAGERPRDADSRPGLRHAPAARTPSPSSTTELALDETMLPSGQSGPGSENSASLTQVGDVIGSPLYMAPEIWRGEPATRQADVYSLGTLLYELCAGRAPFEGMSLTELSLRVQDRDAVPLAEAAPSADPRFCAIVDRCLRKSPAARYESGEALRAALEQLDLPTQSAVLPLGNPYRGLQSFEMQHHGVFFGRAAEIGAIVDRLRSEPLVLCAGNSGVGKSSLCKAGVLAQLAAGALGPTVVATLPAERPLPALASALAGILEADVAEVESTLRGDPGELGRRLRLRNRRGDGARQLVVFIDPLEELLGATGDAAVEVARLGEALAALLAYSPDFRLLGTVRGDYLSRLLTLPGLGPEVARGLYLLGPLSPDGLREAITAPALAMGYAFESAALIESLVNAAASSDGGLPLLQFTLGALWEARDPQRRIIPAAALHDLGGVGGALARHADQIYERLPERQRLAARRILGQLVTIEGSRTRRGRDALLGAAADRDDASAALEALVSGRILSVRSDEGGGGATYELLHEALLSSWGTLRIWLAEDAQLRALSQRVAHAAGEWERLGRGRAGLWAARQLSEVALLPASMLASREQAFLAASRRALRVRLAWRLALVGAIPLVLGLLYAVSSVRARQALNDKIGEESTQARRELAAAHALSARIEELRRTAERTFDERHVAAGESLWNEMLSLDGERRQHYRIANRTAEAAFLLDSRRRDQRDLLSGILFERTLIAERNRSLGARDELYQRLLLFDGDGTFRRRWEAPGHLGIDSSPRGAAVVLTPVDGELRLLVGQARSLGRTPLPERPLPPGTYLLTFSAPGRVETRLPIVLGREEHLALSVPLPTTDAVPAGFVYVPPGRFLFGSDADDAQRRDFFYHVPLHESVTGPYLIAQHETTYADWLLFLRDLPPAERLVRAPGASQEGMTGWLALRQQPDGSYLLITQPGKREFRVREGERIVYPGRSPGPHREVDWLRIPVTGISTEDAQAYLAWLDRTRRVPGARLCTEKEWERAARGADSRVFPHGDRLQPSDANYDQTYGQEPLSMGLDEVGSHPASRSLFGVDDLTGNAFEWVENSVSDKRFALRGGAYYFGTRTDRIDNRQEAEPSVRNPTVGMRVCATIALTP